MTKTTNDCRKSNRQYMICVYGVKIYSFIISLFRKTGQTHVKSYYLRIRKKLYYFVVNPLSSLSHFNPRCPTITHGALPTP